MKGNKILSLLLVLLMLATCLTGCAKKEDALVDGTYSGVGKGFGGNVTVTLVVEGGKVTSATIDAGSESCPPGVEKVVADLQEKLVKEQSAEIDSFSGASVTSKAVVEAATAAFEQAKTGVVATRENVPVTYTAGTYTASAKGYSATTDITLDVTFAADKIENIAVVSHGETDHVGSAAFAPLFAQIIEANGVGVDAQTGATFTSNGVKEAVIAAAKQAKASDIDGFTMNTVAKKDDVVEGTWDVVVVGAGGAGMGAAAEAAQKGLSVLVLEENCEVGGNTLVSGGQFQGTMPYLVWDAKDPNAKTGTFNGETYEKVKSATGCIRDLKIIAEWSEEPFDGAYFKDHEYVAGEIKDIAPHGVHAEFLPVLQALKAEIKEYLAWAQPQLDKGVPETDLTLFSTNNLHIFQTYYGGLRQSADKETWIYSDVELVSQFVNGAYDLKVWLEDQGALFADGEQLTLIGALWYRENRQLGGAVDLDGDGENDPGLVGGGSTANYGAYFAPCLNTILNTSSTAKDNAVMVSTTVKELIVDGGKVVGVKAQKADGTTVIAHANGGVVLATGGYAANRDLVCSENLYWDSKYVTPSIKTTNRSSLQGDGIVMGQAVGAATTGMGFPQMMPISWIDDGTLAFGGGQYAVYISPVSGTRFVNESAERDVLSLGEFNNGVTYNGVSGVFFEITNANTRIGRPYPYDDYSSDTPVNYAVDGRVYFVSNAEELQAVIDEFGGTAKAETVYETIRAYDKSMFIDKTGEPSDGIGKFLATDPVGTIENGEYKLEGETLRIRVMAPSTHHTMGGLVVDLNRHVLNASGAVIEGLYAAGEVTGGIHAGNRLGGNALVEIFVSGRTAADTIAAAMGK